MATSQLLRRIPGAGDPTDSSFIEHESRESRTVLAQRAKEAIGYSAPKRHLDTMVQTRVWLRQQGKPDEALMEFFRNGLTIMPFRPETVARYKAAVIKKSRPKRVKLWWLCAAIGLAGAVIGGAVCLLMLLITIGVCAEEGSVGGFFMLVLSLICVGITGALGNLFTRARHRFGWVNGTWARVPLRGYKGLIPEFATQTALDVEKELGKDTRLYIDEFRGGSYSLRRFSPSLLQRLDMWLDPFLVLQYNGTDHYLEVWNEPGFDKRDRIA
jgi:hypothetical protein